MNRIHWVREVRDDPDGIAAGIAKNCRFSVHDGTRWKVSVYAKDTRVIKHSNVAKLARNAHALQQPELQAIRPLRRSRNNNLRALDQV